MIFGTSSYWAMDSMQWTMNEKRAVQPKWDSAPAIAAPAAAEPVEHHKVIFATPPVQMQAQLDRERVQ